MGLLLLVLILILLFGGGAGYYGGHIGGGGIGIVWDEINWLVAGIMADMAKGQWEKREGPLCKWCPCTDCEHNKS